MTIEPALAGEIIIESQAELTLRRPASKAASLALSPRPWSNARTGVRQLAPVVYLT